jgi:pimeloyl-ACP methyl ester carboxylesterase
MNTQHPPARQSFVDASPGLVLPWPAGALSRTADLDGEVHYLEFPGPGETGASQPSPTVVCLHGLGGSALNFGALGPLLADRSRVLAPDLPGHGRSGVPPSRSRTSSGVLADYVHVVDRFVREVSGVPVLVVGHSLGGVVALLQALEHPETVGELVLLAPPSPRRTRHERDLALSAKRALLSVPGARALVAHLRGSDSETVVRRQLAQATPHPERVPAHAVAAAIAETAWRAARPDADAADRAQWRAILATMALLSRPLDWRRRLATLTVPVLWLQGDDDPLVSAGDAAGLAPGVGVDCCFRTRPGVGHLPHLEDPAWTADRITSWRSGPPKHR